MAPELMSGLANEGEPGTDALAGLSKVVFSTTLTEPLSWPNTQLVTQDPVQAVREMKDNAATSLRTLGSLTLCRSLLKAGLVDRFRVVVFPVITGASGRDRVGDLSGVPVAGALGDQSASLFGHTYFDHGDMKSAYGTGAFLLFTLGTKPVMSEQRPDHYGRMEAW